MKSNPTMEGTTGVNKYASNLKRGIGSTYQKDFVRKTDPRHASMI